MKYYKLFTLLPVFFFQFNSSIAQNSLFVDQDASGANNGSSWSDAYTSLQPALDAATNGDTIWMAAGTYKPSVDNSGNPSPADERTKTFQLIEGVLVFGGFAGTETMLIERDLTTNKTILSGDIGTVDDVSDNCYNVLLGAKKMVLNGLIVEKGNASSSGGGLYIASGLDSILIEHCDFRDNNADGSGGAIHFNGNSTTDIHINHTVFYNNSSNEGGAIRATTSTVNLRYCTFIDNTGTTMGGGIMYWGDEAGSPEIVNCSFIRNISADGGALHGRAAGIHLQVKNCLFYDNTGEDIGLTNSATDAVSYSRITQAGYTGNNNTADNPLFLSAVYGNIVLDDISPCIDAGDPLSPADPDGSNADMGSTFGTDMQGKFLIGSSPSADFATFTEAVDSLVSHVVSGHVIIDVEAGTYTEQIVIPEITGASVNNRIIFQGITGDSTDVILTYAATLENENYTLKLDGAKYITFKNMTLQATGETFGRIVEITNGTKHNSFFNNRFEGVENTGELVCNINNPVIRDSSIVFSNNYFLNGKKAIQWNSSFNMSVTDNMFYHQHDTAIFMVYGRVTSIKNNLFYSNHRETAIALDDHMTDFAIEKNQIYLKNGGWGIDIDGRGENNTLINNYLYVYTTQPDIGIQMYSSFGMTVQMLHNTIHIAGDNESTVCYNDPNTFYEITLQSNNNNFVNMAGGAALSGRYVYGNYNNLYTTGPYLTKNFDHQILELLQQGRSKELNSVSVNPHFIADTSWLPTHPALNDSGLDVSVAQDIKGKIRNVDMPDIGACEFTPSPTPFSGNYSIGGDTPDFETMAEAVDELIINGINGEVIFTLKKDTFPEVIQIPEITGSSSTNTITFTSTGADTALILSDYDYTIKLDGADFVRFNRLKIQTVNNLYAKTILMINGATNNEFSDNTIAQYANAYSYNESYLIFSPGSDPDTSNLISNNHFINGGNGIIFSGSDGNYERGNVISGNVFSNISYRSIRLEWQHEWMATGNLIENFGSVGIQSMNCKNGIVANNMIHTTGTTLFGIALSSTENHKIYYNTIKITATLSASASILLNGKNNDLKNNIVKMDAIGTAIDCVDSTSFQSDNNVFHTKNSVFAKWLGQNVSNFEAWQDSSKQDSHSYFFEPEFLSEDDLHTNDLRLNNVGTPVPEVTTDFDGEARDANHPDIGADEVDLGIPMAGEYFIGPSRQFTSFTQAIDSLVQVSMTDSITFLVDAGTYNEQVVIPYIPNVASERPVVFRPAPENTGDVIVEYTANNTDHYVIKLDSAQFVTLENMTINALDTLYSTAIYIVNGTHDVTISNNIINSEKNPQTSAVKVEYGNNYNIRVSGNTITGGFNGIDFKGEEGNPSVGNILTGNTLLNQYHSGIFMQYQKWHQIIKNRVSHPDPIENLWIGIDLYNCGNYDNFSLIANNMIDYHATEQSGGLAMFNCSYQNIYHNNIHVHGSSSESRTLNLQDGCSNIYTYNNILSNSAGGVLIYAPDLSVKYFDYNVLHATGDRFIYVGGWIDDLAAWNAVGKGANSLTLDPLFVSDSDLHINQLQLFGKGVSIPELADDFDGDSRDPANTTIGADVMIGTCPEPLSGVIPIGTGETYEAINDAVASLILCGMEGTVVFEMAPGTYNEQFLLPESFTGKTPEDSIIFRSATGNAKDVIITFDAPKDNNYVIKLDGLDNFVLQNITVAAQNSHYGRLIEIENHVNNSLFDGNIFKGIATEEYNDSITLIYYHDESIDSSQVFINNTFINGSRAILKKAYAMATDLLDIRKNDFLNQGYGVIKYRGATLMLFEENRVKANTSFFRGIEGGMMDSLSICQNIIKAEVQEGIFLDSYVKTIFMANNFISFESFSNKPLNLIKVDNEFYCYHNTMDISGNNPNSNVYKNSGTNNYIIELKNNVAANLALGKVFDFYHDFPNYNADYNNLYSNGELFGKWGGTTYQNFSEYVSAKGHDANSVSANPGFLNDSTWHSQHILHSNTGTPIAGISTDLKGNPRDPSTPDIGAEEFSDARYSLGGDIRRCAGDQVEINAGTGFDSYEWSTGSTEAVAVIDTMGVGMGEQQVSVSVSLNGNEYNDTILVNLSLPIATPVSDYCFNENQDSIMITAGDGVEYSWNSGESTQSIYITGGNWHYVTVKDKYGCISDGEIYVHYNSCVADMNMPADTVITLNDSIILESSSPSCTEEYTIFDYFWNTGDTTKTLLLYGSELGVGTHEIVVTITNYMTNGCTSSDTIQVTVDKASGYENRVRDAISVYPNPTSGKINIQGKRITSVEMFDMLGNLLYKDKDKHAYVISLDNEPNGIYLLKIQEGERVITRKVILHR